MLVSIIVFLLGLFIGSFLNCLIYRLWHKQSFLKGRSYCPKCKHKLSWYDLIPVLSFLILRGKCRYCQEKISWQYPLVEMATGFLFFLVFIFQSGFVGYYFILASCFLIVIFVYDLQHFIIPDKVIFSAIGVSFLYQLIFNWILKIDNQFSILNYLGAAFVASAFFLFIVLISQGKWMGLGDVKLAFFMGLLLGFPNILVALFLAFSIGAIIGVGLVVFGRKKLKSEIPFGPFLVGGTLVAMFFSSDLINWYLNLFI